MVTLDSTNYYLLQDKLTLDSNMLIQDILFNFPIKNEILWMDGHIDEQLTWWWSQYPMGLMGKGVKLIDSLKETCI